MMRRLAVLSLALATVCLGAAGVSAKPTADTGPGCGLGKMAWSQYKKQKSIGAQGLMGITNMLFPPSNQGFGITYETLVRTNDEKLWAKEKETMFAGINLATLPHNMAQGRCEHLA